MNHPGLHISLLLGLLGLGLASPGARAVVPAPADRYIVEPIVDGDVSGAEAGFSEAELDQLLAPIALYPDALLSQVLIAATYPLEIVSAARWSRDNPRLEGEDAVAAVAERDWDPSVKALVAFPDLLARLDEDLDWTRNLGDAVLLQEQDVMNSIQFLRARADANGSLETTEYARVIREEKTIIIEPTTTRIVHVPYYDPLVVYGGWWRPAYPPVVWARPANYYYGHPGFYWGSGVRISSGFFFSSFYWPQRSVVIVNTPRYYHPSRHKYARPYYTPGQPWVHNPSHRRGVHYRHHQVRERYRYPGSNDGYRSDHRGSEPRKQRPDSRRELLKTLSGESRPIDRHRDERLEGRPGRSKFEQQVDQGKKRRDADRSGAERPDPARASNANRLQSTNRFQAPQARSESRALSTTRAPATRVPASRAPSDRALSVREPSRRALSTREPVGRAPSVNRAPATSRAQAAPRVRTAPTAQAPRSAAPAPRASRPVQTRQAPTVSRSPSRSSPTAVRSQSRAPKARAEPSGRTQRGNGSQQER